jgi:hypothetical protein
VIETDTESNDSDNDKMAAAAKPDVMSMMDSKNSMVRLIIYAKMKKMIKNYQINDLPQLDKRLIRGIYNRRLKDTYELEKKPMTILERIMNSDIGGAEGIDRED